LPYEEESNMVLKVHHGECMHTTLLCPLGQLKPYSTQRSGVALSRVGEGSDGGGKATHLRTSFTPVKPEDITDMGFDSIIDILDLAPI
jgi:hypothetical protein